MSETGERLLTTPLTVADIFNSGVPQYVNHGLHKYDAAETTGLFNVFTLMCKVQVDLHTHAIKPTTEVIKVRDFARYYVLITILCV